MWWFNNLYINFNYREYYILYVTPRQAHRKFWYSLSKSLSYFEELANLRCSTSSNSPNIELNNFPTKSVGTLNSEEKQFLYTSHILIFYNRLKYCSNNRSVYFPFRSLVFNLFDKDHIFGYFVSYHWTRLLNFYLGAIWGERFKGR